MNVNHRSSSLVTHLFLRLHQPEAKYRTPFALATPFADLKVSNIRRLLLSGVLLLNLLLPSIAQAGRGGRGIDQNGDGVIGDNEGHLAAAPRIISDRSDGTRQTVVDLMQLVHVIEVGMDVDGDGVGDLDPSRVSYFGNSLGGIYGTILLAVEPSIRVGVAGAAGELIESFRLGGAGNRSTVAGRRFLASRNPSLINRPGITKLNGVALVPPYFNENLPLRDGVSMTVELEDRTTRVVQSPVINAAPGAMAIQEVFEHYEWVSQSSNPVAFARHLQRSPLAGMPQKSVLFLFAKGDLTVPKPDDDRDSAGGRSRGPYDLLPERPRIGRGSTNVQKPSRFCVRDRGSICAGARNRSRNPTTGRVVLGLWWRTHHPSGAGALL